MLAGRRVGGEFALARAGRELGQQDRHFAELLAADGVLPTWRLGAFEDVEEALRNSLARLRSSRELLARGQIRGFIFDPETGALRELADPVQ